MRLLPSTPPLLSTPPLPSTPPLLSTPPLPSTPPLLSTPPLPSTPPPLLPTRPRLHANRPRRVPPPSCVVDVNHCLTPATAAFSLRHLDGQHLFMLPEERDVCDIASLITECFYDDSNSLIASQIPAFALQELRNTVPPEYRSSKPALQEHWRSTYNGLRLRSLPRMRSPHLEPSFDSSLILTLQELTPGCGFRLICCCELTLRPIDGRLPGELLPPRPLQMGFAPSLPASYGAYLANLAVRPSHRRRGLGRRMLEACEQLVSDAWGMEELYLHVDLHNTAAASLYHVSRGSPVPYPSVEVLNPSRVVLSAPFDFQDLGFEQLPSFDDVCKPAVSTASLKPIHHRYHRKDLKMNVASSSAFQNLATAYRVHRDRALERWSPGRRLADARKGYLRSQSLRP